MGAKNVPAKVLILSQKDDSYFVSFKFQSDIFLKFDEPFVLISDARVIGGGRVLNPVLEPLKKAGKILFLAALLKHDFVEAFSILKRGSQKWLWHHLFLSKIWSKSRRGRGYR